MNAPLRAGPPPPREPRRPEEHYAIADALVAELDAMKPHELVLPPGKSKMVLADLHARLAGCARPEGGNAP